MAVGVGASPKRSGLRPVSELRILHVVEAFGSGVLEVVRSLCDHHVRQGAKVRVAYGTRPETPPDAALEVPPGTAVSLPWTVRTPRAQASAHMALRQLVREWRPDVAHLHSSFAGAVGVSALAGDVPIVYTPHAYSFTRRSDGRLRRRLYLAIERYVSARADVVGAVSEAEGQLARTVAHARNVQVIPNGIPDLDDGVRPPAARSGRPLVLAMGRIGPQRQPEACARILARVGRQATVRWLGGGGDARSRSGYEALARAGVPISGWVTHSETLDRLAGATAYLHWTAWDGAPLSVLEAMSRDVVVVASDIPPNRELLGERQTCATEEEAVALLGAVVSDPDLRSELLAEQRSRARRFGAKRMAADWVRLYRRLAATA